MLLTREPERLSLIDNDLLTFKNIYSESAALLSEAYFGKSPYLLTIEKNLEIIRQKLSSNPLYSPASTKEDIVIREAIKKQFNFEEVIIAWTPSTDTLNAYTISINSDLDKWTHKSYQTVRTSNSIRFKEAKNKSLYVCLHTSLFTVSKFTSAEVTAILLHEIGHNFYNTPYTIIISKLAVIDHIISTALYLLKNAGISPKMAFQIVMGMFEIIVLTNGKTKKLYRKMEEYVEQYPQAVKALNFITSSLNALTTAIDFILSLKINVMMTLFGITLLPAYFAAMPIMTLYNFVQSVVNDGYRNEKFADNFVTMHGYGPEMASSSEKMNLSSSHTLYNRAVSNIPVISTLNSAKNFIIRYTMTIGECHPDEYTRVKDQATLLQKELKKENLPERHKQEMMKELKRIEETYDRMDKSIHHKEDGEYVQAFFTKLVKFTFGERKDPMELIYRTKDYEYKQIL